MCQYIALLLSHSADGPEVTAVTQHVDLKSTPIHFDFIFTKNRDEPSVRDTNRAAELGHLIRKEMPQGKEALMSSLHKFAPNYSSHTYVQQAKHILRLTPPIITHLGRIKSTTPHAWQFEYVCTNEADPLLAQIAKKDNCTPLDVVFSMLTVVVRISYQLQLHQGDEQQLLSQEKTSS
jgi:hypothetical protein